MPEQNNPLQHVLDDQKRSQILALLTLGSSRRRAAQFVGCAPSTITRAVQRDADFSARVAMAEQSNESLALSNLRAASRCERYWRASAWLLERLNPDDFAARRPRVITGDQLIQTLAQITEILLQELPPNDWQRVTKLLDHLMEAARQEAHDCLHGPAETSPSDPRPHSQNPTNELSTQHPPNDLYDVTIAMKSTTP